MNESANPTSQPAAAEQLIVCNQARTAALLDFHHLVDAVALAASERAAGKILSPERLVLPMGQGGVMLSMPATAHDIGIHKLVNVQAANSRRGLPTIHGVVTVCDAVTGVPLCLLDGPELTGRRTAAVSMVAIRALHASIPEQVLIIGTGVQALHHLQALHALRPDGKVWVRGTDATRSEQFCRDMRSIHGNTAVCPAQVPDGVGAVIMVTTSREPIYDEPARRDRVIVGVGAFKPEMAEIGKTTLDGSELYADDPAGARHEAGDLLRAGVDWTRVRSLAELLAAGADRSRPAVFKSVGQAAWDLAAARVALQHLAACD